MFELCRIIFALYLFVRFFNQFHSIQTTFFDTFLDKLSLAPSI